MKKAGLLLLGLMGLLLTAVPSGATAKQADDYAAMVNPWIGTGGHGHVFLGANVPYGFIQLGPTAYMKGRTQWQWDWCSGYHYGDRKLLGFSHMHLSGTGIGDLGDIIYTPVADAAQDSIVINHESTKVSPGYYSVDVTNPAVRVELTATTHMGIQRYTAKQGGEMLVRIDLQHGIGWDDIVTNSLRQVDSRTIVGSRVSTGWAKHQEVYFMTQFSADVKLIAGDNGNYVLQVENAGKPLIIKTALSAASEAGAKANFEAEGQSWDFDAYAKNARKDWNRELGRVKIETADVHQRHVFYTALYHAMEAPSVFNDVDGEYYGADGKVHKGSFTNYTTLSLWDTYRSAMPLMSILQPKRFKELGEAFIHIADEQGKLPVWHLVGNETDCMVGNPGVIIMGDMVMKGLVSDPEAAYQAMRKSVMKDDRGQKLMRQYGYIPFDKDSTYETVAKTLEYAIAFDAVAKVAKKLGHDADYEQFYKLSQAYRNLFDPSDHFMKGRDSKGNLRSPKEFNPLHSIHRGDDYTEGNAWQYTWLVPHDIEGLVSLFPSRKAFISKLDSLFTVSGEIGAEASPDISGLIGQYAHGNEPSHHIIYMYNYVGQQPKAARLLRQVMNEQYRDDPDGLSGNEDVGQMSSWFLISSMGLYETNPSSGRYDIGYPLFPKVTVNLENGKTFTVIARGNDGRHFKLKSATLNGKRLSGLYVDYADIMRGGTLVLEYK